MTTSLRERLSETLKTAMRGGDKRTVSTVRLIQSALKDKDIEARGLGREPLEDGDILGLLQKMIKQRQESLAIYEQANRPELADQEREEIEIVSGFLPRQMSEEEMQSAVEKAIQETGSTTIKDMGKVVGSLKSAYSGQMDFARASALTKQLLSKG